MRWVIATLVFCTFTAVGRQIGRNSPPGNTGQGTFTIGTQLVVETVALTDKKGKPIEGLTAKDFTITEDGVLQAICVFEYQKLEPSSAAPAAPPQPEHVHIYDKLGRTQISPERTGETRYKDHRLLALYFDMTAMPSADQLRALEAAQKFIRTQMTSSDLMAILRYSGGAVEVLQDFTDNRDRLLSIVETMIVGEGQGFDESTNDASTSDTGAAFGQDDTEFNIFNTDRQLSALQTAAKILGQLSEKKSLVYFASGLRLNGLNNQAQLHATINAAIRAGVSFWPVDARGLVAQAPLGDATKGSPGNVGMYSGAAALATMTNFQQSQDSLYSLAADTGGKALFDYNDLAKGIREAEQSVSSYYILGYYTTNKAQDGKFRRIKISLNTNLSANLDYRQGYFAGKQFSRFSAAEKERQLEDALMLADPITELTIAMENRLLPVESGRIFCSDRREDSRPRTGACQARWRRTHVD
jgi:VWFA-related protein